MNEEKISEEVRKKGNTLLKLKRVIKELETESKIHFKVRGETDVHSVIFDKIRKRWSCDCLFFSLHTKTCSHIFACKLFLELKTKE